MLSEQGTVADAVEALARRRRRRDREAVPRLGLEQALVRQLASPEATATWRARQTPGVAVIGEHPAMRQVLERVEQIADTDASVLIRGETGTGKEVIARLIHGASRRRAGAVRRGQLAAIPEALAESELFGHVRGAFTGADSRAPAVWSPRTAARCSSTRSATCRARVQAKLLRVLQERVVTPVGGGETDSASTCASSRPPTAIWKPWCRTGRSARTCTTAWTSCPIEIPPLRERREDIPALAEHFRDEVNAREGRSVPGFALDVMQRLSAYDWPGNVRELENLVERLVVVAGTRMVMMQGSARVTCAPGDRSRIAATLDLPASGVDLRELLTELEERFIAEALERTGGNKNRAAELLGLNRTTLVEKLRRRNVA